MVSKSKPIFSSKPQAHLRPSLCKVQKQTSAGVVPSVSGVWAVGFATPRGDLWKVNVAFLGTVPAFSFVMVSSTVTQYLTRSAQAQSGVFWKGALAVQGLCCECCLFPQVAPVAASDSPKAMAACPLLSVHLFVLSSTRRLSKSLTSYTKYEQTYSSFFRKYIDSKLWNSKKINVSEEQKAFISWCETKSC